MLPNPDDSIETIAELLGVSVGTLYNHIPDLKELRTRARPTSASTDRIRSVRWLYRRVWPATCSTNVRRPQETSSHVRRRTRSRSTTRRPATGRSAGNRS